MLSGQEPVYAKKREIKELKLTRKMRVDEILRVASVSMDEFESINPDLLRLLKSKRPVMKGLRIHVLRLIRNKLSQFPRPASPGLGS